MAKLSQTMKAALIAIYDGRGKAVAEGGGYWMDADGRRLKVTPASGSIKDWIATGTIYALEDRGLLERLETSEKFWLATRYLTNEGRATARQLKEAADG